MVDVPESTSPFVGMDLAKEPSTFATRILSSIGKMLHVPYEQMAQDFAEVSRVQTDYAEAEFRREMLHTWRARKHAFGVHLGTTIARNSGRTWYLLFSDDRRQRKRGQRLLGVKRPTGKRTVWKPVDWDSQFLDALREPRDTTWKGPSYDYDR